MGSKYKLFPKLLEEYTKKTTQPVVSPNSALLSFHFSRPESELFTSTFTLDPFSDESLVVEPPNIESLIPLQIPEPEMVLENFRSIEYDSKGKRVSRFRHNLLPYLFIPHDSW